MRGENKEDIKFYAQIFAIWKGRIDLVFCVSIVDQVRRFFKILCPEGGGALPVGEAPPKRGTIFRSQLYERVGKSFISVSKKEQKGEQVHFMAVRKSRQRSVFLRFIHI